MTAFGDFTLCVFCGASPGVDPRFMEAARRVGSWIGTQGHRLVYGGGRSGLMGAVADAALAAGARVTGVIPERLMALEVGHVGIHDLRVVSSMHERKRQMAEAAHAFVALPGGLGTLEELFEIWTWRQLGYHRRPVGLLNTAGFHDPLLAFLDAVCAAGFVRREQIDQLIVDDDPERLLARLLAASPPDGRRADLRLT